MKIYKNILTTLAVFAFVSLIYSGNVAAHCDTIDGPVVATARVALAKGDATPLLKWVRPDKEEQILTAFQKTLALPFLLP